MFKSILLIPLLLVVMTKAYPQQPSELEKPTATLININKVAVWVHADGRIGRSPYSNQGISYPKGTARAVYQDGMIWGGFVRDGFEPDLRVGGSIYRAGTSPGAILSRGVAEDPASPDARIWRIRRDWQTADLSADASEFFNIPRSSVTQNHTNDMRSFYQRDWHGWPWEKGAPYYDENGNGVMDADEEPGLAHADQVVWFVANDLDSNSSTSFLSRWPIGLEMQTTLWAYDRNGSHINEALQNVVFKQVKLIYKGRMASPDSARIDSMFVGQFADVTIGRTNDDLGGCDTTLQLGFGYNGHVVDADYARYNLPPPAFGYLLIQGPLIPSDNPSALGRFGFAYRGGFSNLKMTSFWLHATGGANQLPGGSNYRAGLQLYHLLNGFFPRDYQNSRPMIDHNGNPTRYILTGNPVTGTGFVDGKNHGTFGHGGYAPGSRYWSMNSGPFTMALGDTQEVVLAMVGGLGSDRLASIAVMKHYSKWARHLAEANFAIGFAGNAPAESQSNLPQDYRLYQNYPNPVSLSTKIIYDLPALRNVNLTIYNLVGQKIVTLVDEIQNPRSYAYDWDGKNARGVRVAKGVYLCRLEAGGLVIARKMVVLE